MPALNRNDKVKCEDCAQEYRRADAARHRKRCEKQKEHKFPNCQFYTKSKEEMGCPSCEQEFPSYYSLQQHRRKEHGAKQRKPSDTVADLNKIVEEEGGNGEKLKEELSACQHFLVDTEMENRRHKVFNFQMSKLDTKIINEKLEEVFNISILPLKSTLLSVLFFEILRLVNINISTPMKTILCLKNLICFVL